MQENLQNRIWQKLLDYLQNTEDFVLEQVPEVILQALKYERVMAYLSTGLMLALLIAALSTGFYFWKHPTLDKYNSRDVVSLLGVLFPCIISPFFFIQLCYSLDKLVKIYIAPKYFLIQLVMSLKK